MGLARVKAGRAGEADVNRGAVLGGVKDDPREVAPVAAREPVTWPGGTAWSWQKFKAFWRNAKGAAGGRAIDGLWERHVTRRETFRSRRGAFSPSPPVRLGRRAANAGSSLRSHAWGWTGAERSPLQTPQRPLCRSGRSAGQSWASVLASTCRGLSGGWPYEEYCRISDPGMQDTKRINEVIPQEKAARL
jgi:hypothetical protein